MCERVTVGEKVVQSNAKPINYILLTVTLLEIVTQIYTFTNDIVIINTNSNILYAEENLTTSSKNTLTFLFAE